MTLGVLRENKQMSCNCHCHKDHHIPCGYWRDPRWHQHSVVKSRPWVLVKAASNILQLPSSYQCGDTQIIERKDLYFPHPGKARHCLQSLKYIPVLMIPHLRPSCSSMAKTEVERHGLTHWSFLQQVIAESKTVSQVLMADPENQSLDALLSTDWLFDWSANKIQALWAQGFCLFITWPLETSYQIFLE